MFADMIVEMAGANEPYRGEVFEDGFDLVQCLSGIKVLVVVCCCRLSVCFAMRAEVAFFAAIAFRLELGFACGGLCEVWCCTRVVKCAKYVPANLALFATTIRWDGRCWTTCFRCKSFCRQLWKRWTL